MFMKILDPVTRREREATAQEIEAAQRRAACAPAWKLKALVDLLIAKGVITQADIDAATPPKV